jgi:heat shock protein HtpX
MAGGAGFVDYEKAFRQVTGKQNVIPQDAVKGAQPVPLRAASEETGDHTQRVRETTDALWKLSNYGFIACPCGVTLKIPPGFKLPSIQCPRCHRTHPTGAATQSASSQ